MATYDNKPAKDIDPQYFFLVFPYCFPNGQGLPAKKVLVKRWLTYLIQKNGSPFQSIDFVCDAGNYIMRHGVNLAANLLFKTSPKLFEQSNRSTNHHIKHADHIIAKRGKASIYDPVEVKAL